MVAQHTTVHHKKHNAPSKAWHHCPNKVAPCSKGAAVHTVMALGIDLHTGEQPSRYMLLSQCCCESQEPAGIVLVSPDLVAGIPVGDNLSEDTTSSSCCIDKMQEDFHLPNVEPIHSLVVEPWKKHCCWTGNSESWALSALCPLLLSQTGYQKHLIPLHWDLSLQLWTQRQMEWNQGCYIWQWCRSLIRYAVANPS